MDIKTNLISDFKAEHNRSTVEAKEQWRNLVAEMPYLQFKKNWLVKVFPPYGGATARFTVTTELLIKHKKCISIYCDHFSRLGCMDYPYWEMYPYLDSCDVSRYALEDTAELLADIDATLQMMEGECK